MKLIHDQCLCVTFVLKTRQFDPSANLGKFNERKQCVVWLGQQQMDDNFHNGVLQVVR